MKFSEIQAMWNEDSEIDLTNLGQTAMNTAKITNKYLQIMAGERILAAELELQYKNLKLKKWEFYQGKGTAEEYKIKKIPTTILKTDMPIYMDADEDIQKAVMRMAKQEEKLAYLKSIIDALNSRRWDIKNYIEWKKFQNGGA